MTHGAREDLKLARILRGKGVTQSDPQLVRICPLGPCSFRSDNRLRGPLYSGQRNRCPSQNAFSKTTFPLTEQGIVAILHRRPALTYTVVVPRRAGGHQLLQSCTAGLHKHKQLENLVLGKAFLSEHCCLSH